LTVCKLYVKDDKCISKGIDLIGVIIYKKKISKYLEEKHFREFKNKNVWVFNS